MYDGKDLTIGVIILSKGLCNNYQEGGAPKTRGGGGLKLK